MDAHPVICAVGKIHIKKPAILSPVVANGVVFIGSQDNNLYAVNAKTVAGIWQFTTGGWIESTPAVANGVVYFGSDDNHLYALGQVSTVQSSSPSSSRMPSPTKADLSVILPVMAITGVLIVAGKR